MFFVVIFLENEIVVVYLYKGIKGILIIGYILIVGVYGGVYGIFVIILECVLDR